MFATSSISQASSSCSGFESLVSSRTFLTFRNAVKQRCAALKNILIGSCKITCIPRIGNVPVLPGVLQKQAVFLTSPGDSRSISHVISVHADEIVVELVVCRRELNSSFARAVNAVLRKLPLRRRVHRIADAVLYLLRAGRTGTNLEAVLKAALANQLLHDELRHRTSADVAVADE